MWTLSWYTIWGICNFFLNLTLLVGRELLWKYPDDILSHQYLNLWLNFAPSDMIKPSYVTQVPMSHSKLLNHSDGPDKTSAELLLWSILCMTDWTWMPATLITYSSSSSRYVSDPVGSPISLSKRRNILGIKLVHPNWF